MKMMDKINNIQKIFALLLILNLFLWDVYNYLPNLNDSEEWKIYIGVNITLFIGIIFFKSKDET